MKPQARARKAKAPKAPKAASNGIPIIVAGRTLTDIANGVGSSVAFIARCYKGRRAPSLATYFDIVDFTGMDYAEARTTFCSFAKRTRQTPVALKAMKAIRGGKALKSQQAA